MQNKIITNQPSRFCVNVFKINLNIITVIILLIFRRLTF
jgi:hypothetical protein